MTGIDIRQNQSVQQIAFNFDSSILEDYNNSSVWTVSPHLTFNNIPDVITSLGDTVYPLDDTGQYVWKLNDSSNININGFIAVTTQSVLIPGQTITRQQATAWKITPVEEQESGPVRFEGILGSGKTFQEFDREDDIIANEQELVTRALWSNNTPNLIHFYTSSFQNDKQKKFYFEIFNKDVSEEQDCDVEPQFSVAYGHRFGSGSQGDPDTGNFQLTPSKAIYGQYRLLCLNSNEDAFVIDGNTCDSIYVININRARMLEHIDEGSIELNLQKLDVTGSVVKSEKDVIRIIDDSTINPATVKQSGEVYNLVSGSLEDGIYEPNAPIVFGQLYKRKGIIILDGDKLDQYCDFDTNLEQEYIGLNNAYRLFLSISGSAQYDDGSDTQLGFIGRGSEVVKSTHFFVRVKNKDFNHSNNPSYVTGSVGELRHGDMINDPKAYITTVGLYNDNKELVAVAKLSQPVRKSRKEEALIKVRLDF